MESMKIILDGRKWSVYLGASTWLEYCKALGVTIDTFPQTFEGPAALKNICVLVYLGIVEQSKLDGSKISVSETQVMRWIISDTRKIKEIGDALQGHFLQLANNISATA